jgi:CHAT domain-containing protein
VRAISALYPKSSRVFMDAEATEENVKAVAKDARYLHIATHAVLDEDMPLNSGLVMSASRDEGARDNGLLQAWEILDQMHLEADLVTLSACKTALGREMAGEGLLGLTWAFERAGARSVLASLWSVADRSTARLMVQFYGHLSRGRSKDEALRAAQLDLIRGGGVAAHPRHWAAFELFGDWK